MSPDESFYNGNPRVKKDGVDQVYTKFELDEYIKCSQDPVYFIESYCKVISLDRGLTEFKLYGYQRTMVNHFNDNRFSIVLACRQSGKSVTSIAWLLWFILFNAEKQVGILANKGATAREMLSRLTLMLENIPFFLQPGCKELNKGSIVFSNNSKIIAAATSSSSIRGLSLNCVGENTKICVRDERGIFFTKISNLINNEMKGELVEKDHYLIYETTNTVNGKIYVGFHSTNNVNDGYLGSGKLLSRAIAKHGPDKFVRKILFDFQTKEEAEKKEREIVNEEFINRDDTYNTTLGGNVTILHGDKNGFFMKPHSEVTCRQLSERKLGISNTKTQLSIFKNDENLGWFQDFLRDINKYYPELKGDTFNETKRNALLACGDSNHELNFKDERKQGACVELFLKNLLRNQVEEKRIRYENLSKRLTGLRRTDETKEKISIALTGVSKSVEHVNAINKNREKIRKTAEKHRGMKRTNEAKLRMSIAAKKRACNNKGKKFFSNPINRSERGYFLPEEAPSNWENKIK